MDPDEGQEVMDDTAAADVGEDSEWSTLPDDGAGIADDETAAFEEVPEEGAASGAEAQVTLADGTTLTLGEIEDMRKGGLREADYTRKTQTLAAERDRFRQEQDVLGQRSAFVNQATQNLARFIQSVIPPEPDFALSRTNPAAYVQARAERERVMAGFQEVLQMREAHDEGQARMQTADAQRHRDLEDAQLLKAMPQLADPLKRAAFDKGIRDTALGLGFSEAEVEATTDHRVRRLVHYARIGQMAEQNRQNAARRVEAPKPGRAAPAPKGVTGREVEHRKAMSSLRQSGSVDDAVRVLMARGSNP